MKILCFDIGGTKVEVGLFDFSSPNPLMMGSTRIETLRHLDYEDIIRNISDAARGLLAQHDGAEIAAMGLAMPGTVDRQGRRMTWGNSPVFVGRDIGEDLRTVIGLRVPARLINDANAFALAEAKVAIKDAKDLGGDELPVILGVILGTGVGGGLVVGGRNVLGRSGGATEIGHTILYHGGLSCYCGQRGCVEQYLSGPALEAHMSRRRYAGQLGCLSAKDIFDKTHDPLALAVVEAYKEDLAIFLTQMANVYDPDEIVLGGGLSREDRLYDGLAQRVIDARFLRGSQIRISKHRISDSSGIWGAGYAAFELARV